MSELPGGLIGRCIRASVAHQRLVLLLAALAVAWGCANLRGLSVDALPDLSDVQVIVRTGYPGQAPQIVEDQVTFPLATALRAVPGATAVRGYSFFGDSFVYVLFADGVDQYWARARVLEALERIEERLPREVHPVLGPDASGVGWIYEYALVDRTGRNDLYKLRSLQDWWLRYQLQSVPDVAEVATLGGMVKTYQVVVDPQELRASRLTLAQIRAAIEAGNRESGGSVLEMAESEYMVRATGYIRSVEDLRHVPLGLGAGGTPLLLQDVAEVRLGPGLRRGIADLDGEGEVVGGIIVMRSGANARAVIGNLQRRLSELERRLPPGVQIVPTYDRSVLIDRAVRNIESKVLYELIAVIAVCVAFLFDAAAGLVAAAVLPLGVLIALYIMSAQGMSANIMSLGGIAVAIGAMVDAALVMTENVYKRLERAAAAEQPLAGSARLSLIVGACAEVGPALFISLLIIALSFLPILFLEGQERRLFAPLAYTKTYAMLAAALLSITLVPALLSVLVRGSTPRELGNPLNRLATRLYRPVLVFALHRPRLVVGCALLLVLLSIWPIAHTGVEFLPDMDEGDLLYMPMALPGISAEAARRLLLATDRLLASVPEVERVFGKAGRADSATDPAPLEMLETVVKLRPRAQWRAHVTLAQIRSRLDSLAHMPGITNSWTAPIRGRIDMLSTGARTPLALVISGPSSAEIQRLGLRIEQLLRGIPGERQIFSERSAQGRYVLVDTDRVAAARYGLNMQAIHDVVELAIGGHTIGETVEGRERYPISLRYPQQWRDSPESIRDLPLVAADGAQLTLGDVARVSIKSGPSMIRSEDALPAAWIYITQGNTDVTSFVRRAQAEIDAEHILPSGYSLRWTGQYEYLQRSFARLKTVVPLTLMIIVVLLYCAFGRAADVLLILGSLPIALCGGAWALWLLDYRLSLGSAIGFIALAGVAVETGVIMLIYLNNAWVARRAATDNPTRQDLHTAVIEGALMRLRPKLMTCAAILVGLLPLMFGGGAGAELMQRIAAPMVGGMVSATLLTLIVIPTLYLQVRARTDLQALN